MKPCRVSLWLALCVSALVSSTTAIAQSAGPGAASEPEAPIVLGTDGGDYSAATAINNRRQVVGNIYFATEVYSRPFLWDDGVMRTLGTLEPTGYGTAADINDRGQIVGVSIDGEGLPAATLWQEGQVVGLETLPGSSGCTPTAISNRGVIAGNCFIAGDVSTEIVAVLWQDGVPVRLALPPGVQALPRDVNDAGVVVGTAITAAGDRFEFVWHQGVLTDVGQLTGRRFEWVSGINRRGQMAGWGPGGAAVEALFWNGRATIVLGGLPGTGGTTANGLNDHGDVVGRTGPSPLLWTKGRTIELPPASVGYVSIPVAINDHGDVVGNAVIGPYEFLSVAVLWPRATRGR